VRCRSDQEAAPQRQFCHSDPLNTVQWQQGPINVTAGCMSVLQVVELSHSRHVVGGLRWQAQQHAISYLQLCSSSTRPSSRSQLGTAGSLRSATLVVVLQLCANQRCAIRCANHRMKTQINSSVSDLRRGFTTARMGRDALTDAFSLMLLRFIAPIR
jgi:hypothetical protein